jgi:hypothetical protein
MPIPQTKQGADILASALKLRVIMPDFFEGKPWPVAKHPPQNDEDKKACVPLRLGDLCWISDTAQLRAILFDDCRTWRQRCQAHQGHRTTQDGGRHQGRPALPGPRSPAQ